MVLIDTSAWIFALKRNFNTRIKERIGKVLLENEVAINGIIALELLGGAAREKEYERLKGRLDALQYVETTKALWDNAAKLAFTLHGKGANVPYIDILIAETAIQENAVLLHADAHFELIAKYSKLKTESLISLVRE